MRGDPPRRILTEAIAAKSIRLPPRSSGQQKPPHDTDLGLVQEHGGMADAGDLHQPRLRPPRRHFQGRLRPQQVRLSAPQQKSRAADGVIDRPKIHVLALPHAPAEGLGEARLSRYQIRTKSAVMGVRGLDELDLKSAVPDDKAVEKLQTFVPTMKA